MSGNLDSWNLAAAVAAAVFAGGGVIYTVQRDRRADLPRFAVSGRISDGMLSCILSVGSIGSGEWSLKEIEVRWPTALFLMEAGSSARQMDCYPPQPIDRTGGFR